MQRLFIELLQVMLGARDSLSRVPSDIEWNRVFEETRRQALTGILTAGLDRLPNNQRPPKAVLLQWMGLSQQIETQNRIATITCIQLCDRLDKDGYYACVLKGQSNYRYYPSEMKNLRSCGDVDVWVVPKAKSKHPVKDVVDYVDANYKMDVLCWLHNGFTDKNGVPMEVHFRPSFMSAPCKNRRFQRHFSDIVACRTFVAIDGVEIPAMTVDEDVIYQMNHIYRHLVDEGVGLRQVVDYFYVLKAWNNHHVRTKEETMKIVSWLGMKRFAGALMYVMIEYLGMSPDYLLCPASKKDGEFLMNEIMMSGNFGHDDPRKGAIPSNGSYTKMRISQAWRRLKRNMHFLSSYPGEVFWEPIVRVAHFIWKKLKLWRF